MVWKRLSAFNSSFFVAHHNVTLRGHLALNTVFTNAVKKKIRIVFSLLFLYKEKRGKKIAFYRPTYSNYDVLFK